MKISLGAVGRFHMFDLARHLAALGEEVRLFTGFPPFKVDADLRPITSTRSRWVLAERGLGKAFGAAPSWVSARAARDVGAWIGREVARGGADVLDALDGVGLEAGRAVKRSGGKWVCNRGSAHILTQKALLEEEHRRWGSPLPRRYFHPEIVERCCREYEEADAISVPSRFAARSFAEQGVPEDKVHICPYGVDVSLFRPEPKQDGRFKVLFVGALSIQKGIGYLLDAVRPLVQRGAVELWLVGGADPLAQGILAANGSLFRAFGTQPRAKLSWFYSQADVLVMPSVQEGLALVQAQAMACGTPLISSTNTGAEDLFTDGVEGFIVPPRDSAAIRERIEWMLDNPVRREQMGRAALARVRRLGGWREYGMRCLGLYRALAAGAVESTKRYRGAVA